MIPILDALKLDFYTVPVKDGTRADGTGGPMYQFSAYVSGGRYADGAKAWDVRAWEAFDTAQYTPFTVAPTTAVMHAPLLAAPIPVPASVLCLPDQADKIFKEIGQGTKVEQSPLGEKVSVEYPASELRHCYVLELPTFDIDFGSLLAKRLANGIGPDGWGAPGDWELVSGTINFVFDPPQEPVAKPTDWTPVRVMTLEERSRLVHDLFDGDQLRDPSNPSDNPVTLDTLNAKLDQILAAVSKH